MLEGLILKGVGGLYTVDTAEGIYMCKPRGIFRKNKISPLVGDMVSIGKTAENEGVIEIIHERRSVLIRPKVANITQALIVFAYKEPDLHMDLLDRFIINCEAAGIESIICLNKIDLIGESDRERFEKTKNIYTKAGYRVLAVSTYEGLHMEDIVEVLEGETTVFAGPSGAGKSSIVNMLLDSDVMETGQLSEKIRRGKHTTRHTQLIKMSENSYIVDSPGFSSIFFENVNINNLKHMFREFKEYEGKCHFLNCNHIDEPDCEVKKQVSLSTISESRYNRYLALFEEMKG